MNILIACDKFKGSLSALDVCRTIQYGMEKSYPDSKFYLHPMADGGDGSLAVIEQFIDSKRIQMETIDPLGRPIQASYLLTSDTAYIELAEASGIARIVKSERNPFITTTLGTGKLLKDALEKGVKKVVLLIGGSSTNEMGLGIAKELGFIFLDKQGKELIPTGGNLQDINLILSSNYSFGVDIEIWCDVTNPLYGPTGAAYVYAPQKGANTAEKVQQLDNGLQHVAQIIREQFGRDISQIPGGGAAGGIGAGFVGLFDAKIVNGFDALSALSGLETKIKEAHQVITGEGRLDSQSLDGKVIGKIAELCQKYEKPLTAVVGQNELDAQQAQNTGIKAIYSIMGLAPNEETAIREAKSYLLNLAREL